VVKPTHEQLALLGRWERLAFRFVDRVNKNESLSKRTSNLFLRTIGLSWVWPSIRNLLVTEGMEHLRALDPPGGLLIASNHRSFFDLYVVSCVLYRDTKLMERIYFPVRTEFFYTNPMGLVVNGLMSAWSMYPPVLRQPERSEFNKYAMARIAEVLSKKGSVVGFHPEGTRNKTDDPYTLLPAQPGVGQLIMQARPTVIPVFVHGMSNDFVHQIRSNYNRTGKKVIVIFGEPMSLDRFYAMTPRLRTYMDIARHVRDRITELGARERELRRELEGTEGSPSGPTLRVA
jgi:1-acyl-sn-glycerol-3-phosphate acyltransferase